MAEQTSTEQSLIETVKPIIAQCRREIAAAWTHVDAAREVLHRSRPLQARWAKDLALAEIASPELSHDRPRSEGFVMVPALKRRRSRRRLASV